MSESLGELRRVKGSFRRVKEIRTLNVLSRNVLIFFRSQVCAIIRESGQ